MDRTALHQASIKGHTEIVKALIEFGANPNCKDFDQCCPLHCASENGQVATLNYLLTESKADPLLRNKFGYIAADIAQNLQARETLTSTTV
jgi:ankyrin repeat protein